MENRNLYIVFSFMVVFAIFVFSSCEKEIGGEVFISKSKIWINSVIKSNDTIKIFLGTTSGMNSGDIARYRDDASVDLYVNNSDIVKKLIYKKINDDFGFYYYPRLSSVKSGDSLRIEAWIDNTDFLQVEGKTMIPYPAIIDSVYLDSYFDLQNDKTKVDISIHIDTTGINDNKYFILQLQNQQFSTESPQPEIPDNIDDISIKNNLVISYGMFWNETLHSILVDYEKLEDEMLHATFYVDKKNHKNQLLLTLKTITKDYYLYSKTMENSGVVKSNILNGTGIFAGYSESTKTIFIK